MRNQVAVITGYASGLGRSLTEKLLDREWVVIGVSRRARADDLEKKFPGRLHHVSGSVAEQRTVDEAFNRAEDLGLASLVINCAGQGVFGAIGNYSTADILTALDGNLTGLIVFSDRAVNHFQKNGGDIINVMSTASKKLRPAESVYTAAKWGAKAYTRTLREAIKSQKLKIRVFEVYPCGMNTAFWTSAVRPVASGKDFPEPGPIAEAILSAALSGASSYVQELTFERS